jgi:hypothetical protein
LPVAMISRLPNCVFLLSDFMSSSSKFISPEYLSITPEKVD